jgi:hypothetical protein
MNIKKHFNKPVLIASVWLGLIILDRAQTQALLSICSSAQCHYPIQVP